MNWHEVWSKKGTRSNKKFTLNDLMGFAGFDTTTGIYFSEDSWLNMVDKAIEKLQFKDTDKLCEVGCGAGAFLYPLYIRDVNCSGIDYSSALVSICNKIMPDGQFNVAMAENIPFSSEAFDLVTSHSVFQYFHDYDYAFRVIKEITRILKRNGRGLILDINDYDKKDEFEQIKRNYLTNEEFEKLYKDHAHMYYQRAWFEAVAHDLSLNFEIYDFIIPNYINSNYRFNFYFEKK